MSSNIPRFWRNLKSRYNLIGTKCLNCGDIHFPPRHFCPKCRRLSRLENFKMEGRGEIVTYTVIHTAMEGFEGQIPYALAIVKLSDGPMLTTQIVDCEIGEVKVGMKVKSVFRKIQEDGEAGLIHYGYKFKPVE
ncbi:MAG: Zn-ribbon domain-containing OB-fold protein [Candidatus Hydrothermarchaeaceae archaeon]